MKREGTYRSSTVQLGDQMKLSGAAQPGRYKTDVELLTVNTDMIFDILTFFLPVYEVA